MTGHDPTNGDAGAPWAGTDLAPGTRSCPHEHRGVAAASAWTRHQARPAPWAGAPEKALSHAPVTLPSACAHQGLRLLARPWKHGRPMPSGCQVPGTGGGAGQGRGRATAASCPKQGLLLSAAEPRAETSTCPALILCVPRHTASSAGPSRPAPRSVAHHAHGLQGVTRSPVPDQRPERAASQECARSTPAAESTQAHPVILTLSLRPFRAGCHVLPAAETRSFALSPVSGHEDPRGTCPRLRGPVRAS